MQDLPYGAGDVAQGLGQDLARFLYPLLVHLDQVLDKRLVCKFLQAIEDVAALARRRIPEARSQPAMVYQIRLVLEAEIRLPQVCGG